MLPFLASHGVDTSSLRFPATFPDGGRGVAAARPLRAGETVLSVPKSAMLESGSVLAATQLGRWVSAYLPGAADEDEVVLALLILAELGAAGSDTPLLPYLESLPPPSDFPLLPWTWEDAALLPWTWEDAALLPTTTTAAAAAAGGPSGLLDLLGDPDMIAHARERHADLRGWYERAHAAAAGSGGPASSSPAPSHHPALLRALTWPSFAWAVACVQSRAFLCGLGVDPFFLCAGTEGMLPLALVPMGDMFNHACGALGGTRPGDSTDDDADVLDAEWVDDDGVDGGGAYVLRTRRAYGEGEQLLISYGDRHSRDTLEAYGFVVPYGQNGAEAASLPLRPALEKDASRLSAAGKLRARMYDELGSPTEVELVAGPLADTGLSFSGGCGDLVLSPAAIAAAETAWSFGGPPTETMQVLRVLSLDEADLQVEEEGEEGGKSGARAGGAGARPAAVGTLGNGGEDVVRLGAGTGWGETAGAGGRLGARGLLRAETYERPISRRNELAAMHLLRGLVAKGVAELYGPLAAGGEVSVPPLDDGSDQLLSRPSLLPPASILAALDASTQAEMLARAIVADEAALLGGTLAAEPSNNTASSSSSSISPPPTFSPRAFACGGADGRESGWAEEGTTVTRVVRARAAAAAQYRINRARVLLLNLQHAARLLQIAEGVKEGDVTTPGARVLLRLPLSPDDVAPIARRGEAAAGVAFGLEVQVPWSTRLLSGEKLIETRAYPLPEPLLLDGAVRAAGRLPSATVLQAVPVPTRVAILESPVGGLAVHGLASAKVVGFVTFGACKVYRSRAEWAADSALHCVQPDAAPEYFGWNGEPKYGWVVSAVERLTAPLPVVLTEADRVVRSIFRMPGDWRQSSSSSSSSSGVSAASPPTTTERLSFSRLAVTLTSRKRDAEVMGGTLDLTGVVPWTATQLLAQLLADHTDLHQRSGARIVELGCGTALLGSTVAAAAATAAAASPTAAASSGPALILVTDALESALPLAQQNLDDNAGGLDGLPSVVRRAARLRWGDDGDTRAALAISAAATLSSPSPPSFDLALAGEVFYLHRGGEDGWGIGEQARALFSTASGRLLRRRACACSSPASPECPCGPEAAGVLLLVYSPRYRGMREEVVGAARALGLTYRPFDRRAVMTAEQRAAHVFTDTRMAAVSACSGAVAEVVRLCGGIAEGDEDEQWPGWTAGEGGAWDEEPSLPPPPEEE
jgi:predicted nicotinamide N-methyase